MWYGRAAEPHRNYQFKTIKVVFSCVKKSHERICIEILHNEIFRLKVTVLYLDTSKLIKPMIYFVSILPLCFVRGYMLNTELGNMMVAESVAQKVVANIQTEIEILTTLGFPIGIVSDLSSIMIPIIKIRRSWDHLIFVMVFQNRKDGLHIES